MIFMLRNNESNLLTVCWFRLHFKFDSFSDYTRYPQEGEFESLLEDKENRDVVITIPRENPERARNLSFPIWQIICFQPLDDVEDDDDDDDGAKVTVTTG